MTRVFLVWMFSATAVVAQEVPVPPRVELSDSARVYLLTMLPGDQVYSKFGHSAIRILDDSTGLDKTYNYGTFEFNQPHFVLRFLRGNLNYILDTAPYDHELEKYHFLRRPMIAQRLNLPTETIRVLYANLEINAHPENRAYRYDFLFDNCSTRILDQLNRALSESELDSLEYSQSTATATFREHLQPYISDTPWLRLGVNLGLGLPADEVATTEQESFLPILLMRILDSASTASGPLVARKDTVVVIPEYEQPSNAFDLPQILLWLVLIVGCVITVVSFRTGTPGTSTRVLDTLLFAVVGFVGLVLTLLWFATQHEVTGPNLNVLWAWPTHLFVAWWLRAKKAPRWLILYLSATAATCVLVLIGWLFWPQPLPTPLLPLVILLVIRATARLK